MAFSRPVATSQNRSVVGPPEEFWKTPSRDAIVVPIRGERDAANRRRVPTECCAKPTTGHVPELHRVIVAAGSEEPAVRAECHGTHAASVADQGRVAILTRLCVPYANGLIRATGGDRAAVGRKRQGAHLTGVPGVAQCGLFERGVPDVNRAHGGVDRQFPPVGL